MNEDQKFEWTDELVNEFYQLTGLVKAKIDNK